MPVNGIVKLVDVSFVLVSNHRTYRRSPIPLQLPYCPCLKFHLPLTHRLIRGIFVTFTKSVTLNSVSYLLFSPCLVCWLKLEFLDYSCFIFKKLIKIFFDLLKKTKVELEFWTGDKDRKPNICLVCYSKFLFYFMWAQSLFKIE